MPVVEEYVSVADTGRPCVERARIPAPRGTSLGQMAALDLWNEIAESMNLPFRGTYTMWALREGDMDWQPVPSQPDTNYLVWSINDQAVARARELAFGNPLPYVVILSERLLSTTDVARLWKGTAYEAYQTEAVYRQDDPKATPAMVFMYWGERRDMPAGPEQTLSLDQAAADADGQLVFAAQVASQGTTKREFPGIHFMDAFQMQRTPLPEEPSPAPPQEAIQPAAPSEAAVGAQERSLVMPVMLGVGAGVLAFAAVRAMQRQEGR